MGGIATAVPGASPNLIPPLTPEAPDDYLLHPDGQAGGTRCLLTATGHLRAAVPCIQAFPLGLPQRKAIVQAVPRAQVLQAAAAKFHADIKAAMCAAVEEDPKCSNLSCHATISQTTRFPSCLAGGTSCGVSYFPIILYYIILHYVIFALPENPDPVCLCTRVCIKQPVPGRSFVSYRNRLATQPACLQPVSILLLRQRRRLSG